MDWLWPDSLFLLGSVPVIVVLYILILRRRYRFAGRYSSLSLVREAALERSWVRRHLPFCLLVIALISVIVALSRPVSPINVLSGQTTIILALDTSRSMCMRDILPSRMTVAKSAALWFVQNPVLGTQVGVVAFAGFAELAQSPTTDVTSLENSIENLTPATQTAIGSAILTSLDAIAKVDERVAPSKDVAATPESAQPLTPEEHGYVPHVIVLLTDGASNTGPSPLDAAQKAAERGVRVYTIGFGTTNNVVMDCWHDEPLGSSDVEPPSGGSFGSTFDEVTLRQIAEMTGGKFYSATSAAELHMVFQDLHSYMALTNQTTEISAYFAAIGAFMASAALVLSLLRHPLL